MNKDWYEVGGQHQITLITAPLSLIFTAIRDQVEHMGEKELGWLFLASENLAHLCEHAMAELDSEE